MYVSCISHTAEPELLAASAARICYSSSTVAEFRQELKEHPEMVTRLTKMLQDIGHHSVFEHISFTFTIEGVSRVLSHQLVRHRIASYSQRSQRYVSECGFSYVIPPAIRANSYAHAAFTECMNHITDEYKALQALLINGYVEEGMDKQAAQKKANEDARFVLPNACETSLIMTMNVRSLYNFFSERCCNRAQWEIRELAYKMLGICKDISPILFENAGPACLTTGKCPEGKMSCGKPFKLHKDI